MFTAHSSIGSARRAAGLPAAAGAGRDAESRSGRILRMAAVGALLAVALPGVSSAQAIGTMQVTARVVPASAAWTGVAEAGLAAEAAVRADAGRPLIRRSGLVHSATEIRATGGRRTVLVTIQHPHN